MTETQQLDAQQDDQRFPAPLAPEPAHAAEGNRRLRGRSRRGSPTPRVGTHLLLILLAMALLYPLVWLLVSSLRPTNEIFRDPGLSVRHISMANYWQGWHALTFPFGIFFANSFIIAAGAIIGNLLSCSLTAYAFARLSFRGRRLWFAVMLASIMLPIHVVIIPQYVIFDHLGWVNTFLPLIVPKFLATDAFFVFLMVQFIRGIPKELDEAARVDGCNHFGIFSRIILPLMTPALAATAIFTFIWTWNDFFGQLIYLSDQSKYTVPLALQSFMDSTGTSAWGPMFAMSVLSLIPLFIIFLVGQRYLIAGISTTGGK